MNNVIKININKKDDYVSKYNDDILSKELSNYILDECKSFGIKDNFDIEITSDYDMDDNEKDKIIEMIRAYFGVEISEMINNRRRTIYLECIILLFGILSIIFYIICSDIPILSDLILILSWILIWDSVQNLIFGGFNNKLDIQRRKKLTNCKVRFK